MGAAGGDEGYSPDGAATPQPVRPARLQPLCRLLQAGPNKVGNVLHLC